jgi:hypothetical protein
MNKSACCVGSALYLNQKILGLSSIEMGAGRQTGNNPSKGDKELV